MECLLNYFAHRFFPIASLCLSLEMNDSKPKNSGCGIHAFSIKLRRHFISVGVCTSRVTMIAMMVAIAVTLIIFSGILKPSASHHVVPSMTEKLKAQPSSHNSKAFY